MRVIFAGSAAAAWFGMAEARPDRARSQTAGRYGEMKEGMGGWGGDQIFSSLVTGSIQPATFPLRRRHLYSAGKTPKMVWTSKLTVTES